ncbi:hypothetical protein QVD17_07617 [Tagetes erecta]|uniref:Uncharacterized protein n=1 Tax=Tagetes erecta TaxID=13708 RepID=A0AAD8PD11_TARER|nr:hypothetical protein QVD17_07617 [Tagetes erecta]
MDVGGHIHIDWDLLNELHEGDRCQEIIGFNTPWSRLFDIATRPSYCELTVEFLSSFVFNRPPRDYVEDPAQPFREITFRLCGVYRSMTLREFACRSGLYMEEELDTPLYTEGIRTLPRETLEVWER